MTVLTTGQPTNPKPPAFALPSRAAAASPARPVRKDPEQPPPRPDKHSERWSRYQRGVEAAAAQLHAEVQAQAQAGGFGNRQRSMTMVSPSRASGSGGDHSRSYSQLGTDDELLLLDLLGEGNEAHAAQKADDGTPRREVPPAPAFAKCKQCGKIIKRDVDSIKKQLRQCGASQISSTPPKQAIAQRVLAVTPPPWFVCWVRCFRLCSRLPCH